MGLFNFFSGKKETPKVNGFSFSSMFTVSYDVNLSVFYKFYEFNGFISAAIQKRMEDVAAHGFEISMDKKAVKMDEFKKLINFAVPYTPKSFIARLVRDYETTSNAYVYFNIDWTTIKGIQILDPRYMKPLTSDTGQIIGYLQNLNGIRYFLPDEILHLRYDNDLKNESVGKPKMTGLFIELESDTEAKESNLAFFKNNQTPASIILVDPDYTMDWDAEADYKLKLKEIFESGKYEGGKHKHRSAFLEGIKDIKAVQDKITDMEFIKMRQFTREMVGAIFWVPDDVLGYTENSNRSVGKSQNFNYAKSIHAENIIFSEFMTAIVQKINPRWEFTIFQDELTILMMKAEMAGSLYKDKQVLTRNEARELIQYEPVKGGDEFFKEPTKEKSTEEKDIVDEQDDETPDDEK